MDKMKLTLNAVPVNEGFARTVVAAFAARLNPSMEVLSDIRTAVSEGVTNAIVHGYPGNPDGIVEIEATLNDNRLTVRICDMGVGIADVKQAMTDFFTTRPQEERSGLGFTIMQGFMDALEVESEPGKGTTVCMSKRLR